MGNWSKEHLLEAWEHYEAVVEQCGKSVDWNAYADLFTEDARYVDDIDEERVGREAIRRWLNGKFENPIAKNLRTFVTKWFTVDEDRGWVIAEFDNVYDDPGDGNVYSFRNYTLMKYAGDFKWSFQEDQYNPAKRDAASLGWMEAKSKLH